MGTNTCSGLMADRAVNMGTDPIGKLLIRQAVPASIGILVMSLNILIDTIFVGQWIGANAIAAINVVLPLSLIHISEPTRRS